MNERGAKDRLRVCHTYQVDLSGQCHLTPSGSLRTLQRTLWRQAALPSCFYNLQCEVMQSPVCRPRQDLRLKQSSCSTQAPFNPSAARSTPGLADPGRNSNQTSGDSLFFALCFLFSVPVTSHPLSNVFFPSIPSGL